MTAVGFEPTRIAPPELESGALDHSAKLSWNYLARKMIGFQMSFCTEMHNSIAPRTTMYCQCFFGQAHDKALVFNWIEFILWSTSLGSSQTEWCKAVQSVFLALLGICCHGKHHPLPFWLANQISWVFQSEDGNKVTSKRKQCFWRRRLLKNLWWTTKIHSIINVVHISIFAIWICICTYCGFGFKYCPWKVAAKMVRWPNG